jgi:hypothetical protein
MERERTGGRRCIEDELQTGPSQNRTMSAQSAFQASGGPNILPTMILPSLCEYPELQVAQRQGKIMVGKMMR